MVSSTPIEAIQPNLPKDSKMLPAFNIDLLFLKPSDLVSVPKVEVLDIFDGVSKNFHSKGLFSVENFGRMGEAKRSRLFGYIDLNTSILHPLLFKVMCDLKSLYSDIMNGKEYAVFDPKLKDFVKSDPVNGNTGYNFFLSHLKDLKVEERDSDKRTTYINVFKKYRDMDSLTMDRLVVLPAGHRDYTIDENGKPSEDEINKLYRSVLATSNIVLGINKSANPEYLDSMRMSIQVKVMEIYDYILDIFDGKSKFVQGKFATRKIYNTTRNVITSRIPRNSYHLSRRRVSTSDTTVGLYQFVIATFPIASKHVRDGFLSNVFNGPSAPAILVNPKTLKKELVHGVEDDYDAWMTLDGFERTMQVYGNEEYRHTPVMIKDMYAGLVYEDREKKQFMIIQDIDDLPTTLDKAKVHPLTMTELLYNSVYELSVKVPSSVTRYPISGLGSIYLGGTYLATTNVSYESVELDSEGNPTERILPEWPIQSESFFNAVSPSPTHLGRLGADFDGDMVNFICYFTDEAIEEINKKLKSASYYKSSDGGMAYSASDDIINTVMAHLFN